MTEKDTARFWSRVNKEGPNGCWEWAGRRGPHYGQFRLHGRFPMAHRVAYELLVGPIPEGLTLDHLCRNTICVNPAHLEPVSLRTNILRGEGSAAQNARKTHCKRGHPLTGYNLLIDGRGNRSCRICQNIRGAKWCRDRTLRKGRTPGKGGHHAVKTHCPQGHPYTPENTYQRPGEPHRICRICHREANRRTRKRRQERKKHQA